MNETFTEAGTTLKFGTVAAVDEQTLRVRVRLPELDNLRTAWLPVLARKAARDKDYWLPDLGEHVAVLLDARGEDGVVLGAIFSEADAVPVASRDKWHRRFADDTELEYDRASHVLTIKGGIQQVIVEVGATILLRAGSKVTIDAPDTEATGNLLVQGKLTYQGGMAGSGGGGAAATISGGVQVTGDVQVDGNITASGSVMDGGGNSNHHSH
jgi:phage baseplate assembly protein V